MFAFQILFSLCASRTARMVVFGNKAFVQKQERTISSLNEYTWRSSF